MIYYGEFVAYKSTLYRWFFILKFSCLKTIAHKYGSTISKVYRRFGKNLSSRSDKTISTNVEVKVNDVTYVKEWSLITFKQAYQDAVSLKQKPSLTDRFWSQENGKMIPDGPAHLTRIDRR